MKAREVRLGLLATLTIATLAMRSDLAHQRLRRGELMGTVVPSAATIQPLTGYFANGLMRESGGTGSCLLLRYVSRTCAYCRSGKTAWDMMASALGRLGCQPLGVVPDASSALAPSNFGVGGDRQLVWLSMDWVTAWHPIATPTTLIFGRDRRILWSKVGALQASDVAGATAAVRENR
ncbi:MAG: hypothetical protein ACRD1A_07870 [Terriglobales bacterium]